MGPASRESPIGGLVPADALSAAARVEENCKPSAGRFVVQSNGVAKGIGEGALPLAAVRRVKVVPPSVENDAPEMLIGLRRVRGIVVGDDDLVGVIRVGRGVCLRLGNVCETCRCR